MLEVSKYATWTVATHYLTWVMAGVISVVLICLLAPLAQRIRLVDIPCARKRHDREVPLIGGVAVFLSFVVTWLFAATTFAGDAFSIPLSLMAAALVAGGLLLLTGLLDDLIDLSIGWRVALTLIAAFIFTAFAGLEQLYLGDLFGFGDVTLSGLACTVFIGICVFGMVNAFNMLDGVDGILGLNVLAAFVCFHLVTGMKPAIELVVLAGALCGYLISNLGLTRFAPRTFMGDNGSMLMGFLVAVTLLSAASGQWNDVRYIEPVTALYIVGLPLIDMVTVTLRRLANGCSPFRANRDHLHHLILNTRAPKPLAIALITLLGATYPTLGALMLVLEVQSSAQFWAIYGLGVLHFGITTTVLRRQDRHIYRTPSAELEQVQ